MGKAVLVLDMPESCDMCNFTDMVNGKMYCGVPGCGELAKDYISCRPDWCPLRELPEKRNEEVFPLSPLLGMTYSEYSKGWNDCIDAIAEPDKG